MYEHSGKPVYHGGQIDQSTDMMTLWAEFPNPDNVLVPGLHPFSPSGLPPGSPPGPIEPNPHSVGSLAAVINAPSLDRECDAVHVGVTRGRLLRPELEGWRDYNTLLTNQPPYERSQALSIRISSGRTSPRTSVPSTVIFHSIAASGRHRRLPNQRRLRWGRPKLTIRNAPQGSDRSQVRYSQAKMAPDRLNEKDQIKRRIARRYSFAIHRSQLLGVR